MLNKLNRAVRPIVFVSKDDIIALCQLVSRENGENSNESKVRICARLADGQDFETNEVDRIFDIPNRSANPIREIKITSVYSSKHFLDITIGGHWHSNSGASIVAKGDPDFTTKALSKFNEIITKEKTILELLISQKATNLSLLLTAAFASAVIFLNILPEISDLSLILYIFCFISLVFWLVFIIQFRFFGWAVYMWGDGVVRYQRNLKILHFLLWTVPVSLALGVVVNMIS